MTSKFTAICNAAASELGELPPQRVPPPRRRPGQDRRAHVVARRRRRAGKKFCHADLRLLIEDAGTGAAVW